MEAQNVITTPARTYFVAYPGTLAAGVIYTIPNKHRRDGDTQDNPQVRVIIQNTALDTVTYPIYAQYPILTVLDNTNTVCADIFAPNAWQLETDMVLKITPTLLVYFTPLVYRVLVFYKTPEGR